MSTHYIRTIHTSFTASASPWAARSSPSLHSYHQMHPGHTTPLYTSPAPHKSMPAQAPLNLNAPAPPSSAGGRRRAYAFRVPPSTTYPTTPKPKFDPFADEPTSPVPSLSHLASLSAPPAPRLAAASLPAQRQPQGFHQGYNPQARRVSQGQLGSPQGYTHPTAAHHSQPRRSGFPGQRSRSPAPSFVLESSPSSEVWKHNPNSQRRVSQYRGGAFEQEFEYDLGVPVRSGLVEPITSRRVAPPPQQQVRASGPVVRRSPSPPQPIARRSPPPRQPQQQPISRPLTRTPSPPAPSPAVSIPQKSQAQLQAERDTRAKLVAGILLNRIHVQKRGGGRRVPSPLEGKRPYRPSGLSQVVAVA